jgi:TetR/AcrR family transcriptional repressor of nem operon
MTEVDVPTTVRILDAAERMLQVRGYNGFSYGDVAQELGITRAALHYHFKGKAELGEALVERYATRFAAALSMLDETAPDAAAKLRGYAGLYVDVVRRDRMCLCGMLAAEYATLPEPLQKSVSSFFDANTVWLSGVVVQGGTEGSLRPSDSPDDVAAMILGALEGAMLLTRLDGDAVRFSAAADRLLAGLAV